jgi:hypothetical protein
VPGPVAVLHSTSVWPPSLSERPESEICQTRSGLQTCEDPLNAVPGDLLWSVMPPIAGGDAACSAEQKGVEDAWHTVGELAYLVSRPRSAHLQWSLCAGHSLGSSVTERLPSVEAMPGR